MREEGLSVWHPDMPLRLVWSASALNDLDACAYRHYLGTVLGYRRPEDGMEARFGKIIHAAFNEFDYHRLKGVGHDEALLVALRLVFELAGDEVIYDYCGACGEKLPIGGGLDKEPRCPKCRSDVGVIEARKQETVWEPWVAINLDKGTPDARYGIAALVRMVIWGADTMEAGAVEPVEPPWAAKFDDGKEGYEFHTMFPREAPGGFQYWLHGFFDGFARVKAFRNSLFVRERKTTKSTVTGAAFASRYSPNLQTELYTWAAPRLLAACGETAFKVVGMFVDAFQTAVNFSRGRRIELRLNDDVIEEFERDVQMLLAKAERCAQTGVWPKERSACMLCGFKKVCAAPKVARVGVLASEFVQDKERMWKA